MALLTKSQIERNLRRTASKGQISLLTLKELNAMAKKHFGIIEDGKLVGYYCPYSGLEIRSKDDLVIEHIIPVSSGGGTVLFNCIPSHKIVNGKDQKGANHLLSWWESSEYFDINRLENLVNYMLEAYDKVFEKHEINEVLTSFQSYEGTNLLEADLTTTSEEIHEKLNEQSQKTGFIKYRQFLADCIRTLEKNGVDVTNYQEKLNELSNKGIFKEIDNYELIQGSLRKIFKEKLDEESRRELTVLLNYDIIPLIDSLKEYNSEEEIYNELSKRIDNLEEILEQNNIGIISYLEDIRNCPNLLAKKIEDITNDDINALVNEINLSVNDKFNKLCEFVHNHKGKLPSTKSQNQKEKQLGIFRNGIKAINKGEERFFTGLSSSQLKYLHDSDYEGLREIYKEILYKAVTNHIEIEYIDEEMKTKILEYQEKSKTATVEQQIELDREYKDYIVVESQFNEFIDFVLKNNGKLPSSSSKDEKEKHLGSFRSNIKVIKKGEERFCTGLSSSQLKYLHDSDYEGLREIYKEILYKAVTNHIEIEYIDEEMKTKILEYQEKSKTATVEQQIELDREYKDYIVVESQFNEFIDFVLKNNGKLPSSSSKDEKEKHLGSFRSNIKVIKKGEERFCTGLSSSQLKYLHDSEYESLREIYKTILNKAIDSKIEIPYVDEEMKGKILEYKDKSQAADINQQIELERKYKDYIIVTNQFNEFIGYVIDHNGELPRANVKNVYEKRLGGFRSSIQRIKKGRFAKKLSCDELKYLHDSEYESLREIYNTILQKSIVNNIPIDYYPPEYENQNIKQEENTEQPKTRKGR